jgi:hypothetical protein
MVTTRSNLFIACLWLCSSLHGGSARGLESTAWAVGEPIFTYNNFSIPDSIRASLSNNYGWPIGYDPTALNPAIAEQAVSGGFNLVWINDLTQLAIAERYGLRAQLVISGHQPQNNLFFPQATKWPAPADVAAIDALIDQFKISPAAYSYFIIDEPSANRFAHLAEVVAYLKERDPAHLAYINLFPPDEITTDLGAPSYAVYLSEFVRTVNPALLSYDSYNLFANNDRSLFLGNMQTVARAAAQAGIPFMAIVQGSKFGSNWRLPTISELRFLTNAPLAFGAQGISYFNYWTPLGPSAGGLAPHPDGTPTAMYEAFRTLSPQFKAVSRQLRDLQWIGTYLKGYVAWAIPRYMTQPPDHASFDVASLANRMPYVDGSPLKGVLLGYFGTDSSCSSPACATHVFVQNLDYTAGKNYRVNGPSPLSVYDADTDAWIPTGHNFADVTLQAGGGVLIGVSPN